MDAQQTSALCELLKNPPAGEEEVLLNLLRQRIPLGVDQAAYVKAVFLTGIAKKEITSPLVSLVDTVELPGRMIGGYNVQCLIDLLQVSNTSVLISSDIPLVMGGEGYILGNTIAHR